MTLFCGIDFGTSNSTVSVAGPQGPARLIALEGEAVTLPSAVFWESDGSAPVFGRAAIAAYVTGEDGRLMRGLKSTLGSSLIDEKTRIGARAVAFRDVLARYIGHLRGLLEAEAGAVSQVVLGRPVHFVDDDAAGDARAQAVLEEIARGCGFRDIAFQYEPIAVGVGDAVGVAVAVGVSVGVCVGVAVNVTIGVAVGVSVGVGVGVAVAAIVVKLHV